MSRRKSITTTQVRAAHWDPHECVVIRSLNTDDEEMITDGLAGIDASGSPRLYAGRNKRLTLERGIVSWTLTDEQNRPLPLNEQSIRGLAPEDSQFILSEIQALNTHLSAAEKKDSLTNATPSTEGAGTPRKPASTKS